MYYNVCAIAAPSPTLPLPDSPKTTIFNYLNYSGTSSLFLYTILLLSIKAVVLPVLRPSNIIISD